MKIADPVARPEMLILFRQEVDFFEGVQTPKVNVFDFIAERNGPAGVANIFRR